MKHKKTVFVILLSLAAVSCQEYTPKPKAYPRIERQLSGTDVYESNNFSFEHNNEAYIVPVASDSKSETAFNILYPRYNATIYCTGLTIDRQSLNRAIDDSYRFAYSHSSKASGIDRELYENEHTGTYATIYRIDGEVATPLQFFVTDSTTNFLRGSLYYDREVVTDSVAPVTEFIHKDIVHLIETLEWKHLQDTPKK